MKNKEIMVNENGEAMDMAMETQEAKSDNTLGLALGGLAVAVAGFIIGAIVGERAEKKRAKKEAQEAVQEDIQDAEYEEVE